MRARTPLILFLILLLVIGATYYLVKQQEKKQKMENLFLKLNAKVSKIEIDRKDGTKLVFEKEGPRWMMRDPKYAEADSYLLGRMEDEVSELRFERVVEEKAGDLKKYGLVEPEVVLKVWEEGNLNPYVIKIGDKNPVSSDRYAVLEGQHRVVLLSSVFTDLLFKDVNDYRNKKIAKFDETKAKKIVVKGKVNYVLQKKYKDWYIIKPVNALANNYKCDDILYSITGAEAKEFVKDMATEEDLKEYGLDKPLLKVTIDLGDEKVRFQIAEKDGEYYLYKGNTIYKIDSSLYKAIAKNVKDLREKRLVRFYSFEVKALSWKRKGEEFRAEKERDKWMAKKPFQAELEKNRVEDFLRNIEDLEAKDFVDDIKSFGFKPDVTVKFELEDGRVVEVEMQEKEGKIYARDKSLNYLLEIHKTLDELFPEKAEDWKKLEEEEVPQGGEESE